jgi:molybdopterin molybdotransferase
MTNLNARPAKPSLSELTSCLSDYDPHAMPVKQAQAIIHDCIAPVTAVEKVALRSALDRVLASDIISPINVPAHDNSAMDGYAFNAVDLRPDADTVLSVVGTAHAGRAYQGALARGQAIRIMTGALMPDGLDTVIPQEFVSIPSGSPADSITIPLAAVKPGANRRLAGEDLKAGSTAIGQGRILRPADLGLLASLGIAEIPVRRRLRVAFFSTGDELRSVGEVLDAGCSGSAATSSTWAWWATIRRR